MASLETTVDELQRVVNEREERIRYMTLNDNVQTQQVSSPALELRVPKEENCDEMLIFQRRSRICNSS